MIKSVSDDLAISHIYGERNKKKTEICIEYWAS